MAEKKVKKEYEFKISLSQIWIALTIFITVIGSSFGAGMKVNHEMEKITIAKTEQVYYKEIKQIREEYEKEIEEIEKQLSEIKRINQENYQNMLFFRNQYNIYLKRFESLSKNKPFVESVLGD